LISRFENIKITLSEEQKGMKEDSRHIRLLQREVQDILDSRKEVLSEQKTIKILNKIRLGNLQEEDLDLDNCLELAYGFDNISSILGLEERDYTTQLDHLKNVMENKILKEISQEIDMGELSFFRKISSYFFKEEKIKKLFQLFDRKFLRFYVPRYKISSSDTTNNLKILKTCFEDLILILETNLIQRNETGGIIPEMNGKALPLGLVKMLKLWDRKIMDSYLEHFFQVNIKYFLSQVLESTSIKTDRSQQHFFLTNLKNFHILFEEFDEKIDKNINLDSITKEKALELRKRVSDDYYEGYFGVEDLYVKNTGLIYTQLMRQNLQKELNKVKASIQTLKENPFVLEKTANQFEETYSKR
jgi:hypothetical protein